MKVSTSNKEMGLVDYTPGQDCPSCGQMVWDNTKKPKINPNSPDFKCSNKAECGLAMWIFKPKPQAKNDISTTIGLDMILQELREIKGILRGNPQVIHRLSPAQTRTE